MPPEEAQLPADDDLVREEEQAAAQEAGAIGGRSGDRADDAQRPVREAGGGVAEGFEEAEAALIDHAEHSDGDGTPRFTQMGEEAEPDPSTHGEPDQVDTTEVTSDPAEGEDDPGAGPGLASER